MNEDFLETVFRALESLRAWSEPASADDPAYQTEFGWAPLPDNVIPLPRRGSDELRF